MTSPKRTSPPSPYYVYVLRCQDGSLYAGITTDVPRRLAEHLSGRRPGAKYTQSHQVKGIVAAWTAPNRATASALEFRIKRLSRSQKLELVKGRLEADELFSPPQPPGTFVRVSPQQRGWFWRKARAMGHNQQP
ncbi:MAG: GIY-YIG nuclease family protein [Coriobacteriales bacterium]|nr:GIY-YIG nuclease family protein [Coriobacteriales bacterium]